MKNSKRYLALVLALIISLSLVQNVSEPAAAATNNAYLWLVDYVKTNGSYDASSKQHSLAWTDAWNAGVVAVIYDNGKKDLYLYYYTSPHYLYLKFDTENTTYAEIYSGQSGYYDAYAKLYCPGYKAEDSIPIQGFSGDTAYVEYMTWHIKAYVPYILEEIHNLLVLTGSGYTIQNFGFRSFYRHNFHEYDDGVVIQEPTCIVPGILRYTCLVCGETKDTSIPSTNIHTWELRRYDKYPTCTEEGIASYRCEVCRIWKNEPVAALGHIWTLTEILSEPDEEHEHGTALYTCTRCQKTKEARLCAGEIFTDMPADDHWAHKPIDWAYFHNITSGTTKTTFSPDMTITRAQAVTFLWAAAGKPEPKNPENPFTDVPDDGWYTKSVLWAVESGVTKGLSADTFGPFETCTRAQIVTFLWAAAGKPEPKTTENPFTDVSDTDWFVKPVLWAVENGVTKGMSADTFGPYASCTRAQVVTFLYKASLIPAPDPPVEPDPTEPPEPDPTEPPEPDPTEPPEPDPTEPPEPDPTEQPEAFVPKS